MLAGHKHGVEKQTEAADHDDCQQVTDDDLRTKLQKVLTEVERFQSLSMVDRLQSDDVLRSKRISRPQPWLNDTVRLASKENVSFVRLKFAENWIAWIFELDAQLIEASQATLSLFASTQKLVIAAS